MNQLNISNLIIPATSRSGRIQQYSGVSSVGGSTSAGTVIDLSQYLKVDATAVNSQKLNGQTSDYYLNYNNLTYKPAIPSVAGLASESYVNNKVAALVNSAPSTLDTLNELAAALGNDPNFATSITTLIAGKSAVGHKHTKSEISDIYELDLSWTKLRDVPTTLAGYGITNAYTKAECNNNFLGISDQALDAGHLAGKSPSFYLDYNNLSNKPNIPSLSGYATEAFVDNRVAGCLKLSGSGVLEVGNYIDFHYDYPNSSTDYSGRLQISGGGDLLYNGSAVIRADNISEHLPSFTLSNLNQIATRNFGDLQNKPTTTAGYGITDAITTGNIGSQAVSYASSAGNADTVDGWHRDDLRYWDNHTGHPVRSNWSDRISRDVVVGQMCWRNYGNGHTIFDASSGLSPNGTSIDKDNSQVEWSSSYPTLMGWNGSNTYGVRVNSAKNADRATNAGNADYWAGQHISDFTSGDLRIIGNYSNTNSWFIQKRTGRFTFANAHDWTQTFDLSLVHNGTANGSYVEFGQRQSNESNGRYRGLKIVKYKDGAMVGGDLEAGYSNINSMNTSGISFNGGLALGNNSNALNISNSFGNVYMGALNDDWCHFMTDKPRYYMNKPLQAVDEIRVYNTNTYFNGSNGYIGGNQIITTNNIGGQSVNYANSAGSANAVGGLGASNIVSGGTRGKSTSKTNGNANTSDASNASGFYFGNTVAGMPTGDWWNWITCAGNDWSGSDGYAFQLATSFWSDDFRIRRMTSGTWQGWQSLIHSGNIGSQTVNRAATAAYADTANYAQLRADDGTELNIFRVDNTSPYRMLGFANGNLDNIFAYDPAGMTVGNANQLGGKAASLYATKSDLAAATGIAYVETYNGARVLFSTNTYADINTFLYNNYRNTPLVEIEISVGVGTTSDPVVDFNAKGGITTTLGQTVVITNKGGGARWLELKGFKGTGGNFITSWGLHQGDSMRLRYSSDGWREVRMVNT